MGDATANPVKEARKTARGIRSVNVENQSALVEKGRITEFKVNCKISLGTEK